MKQNGIVCYYSIRSFALKGKKSTFALGFADVVELVDTLDLGSSAARRGGSTPFIRTNFFHHRWMNVKINYICIPV